MKPDSLPFCFRDRGAQPSLTNGTPTVSRSPQNNSRSTQNSVTCLYRTAINGHCRVVSVTWSKSLVGPGLSVSLDYPTCTHRCSVGVKPWRFWKKQGSKAFDMGGKRIDLFWDLSSAKYKSGPEPHESFYVAISCNNMVVLILGDMHSEALKNFQVQEPPYEAALLCRKEHVHGKELYTTKARLHEQGRTHDIVIECHFSDDSSRSRLSVRVDMKTVIHVTSLVWKFRGNQTIQIDGAAVDVYWDVYDWLFRGEEGHGVFMFRSCCGQENQCNCEMLSPFCTDQDSPVSFDKLSYVPNGVWAPLLHWPMKEMEQSFILLLYAWNHH